MAAEPVLASTLRTAHKSSATDDSCPPSKRKKLSTDCHTTDKALHGGLEYGKTHCISAEVDSGAKEICYAFLKSHLLDNEQTGVTIIDATNSFNVRKLHSVLVVSLQESVTSVGAQAQALQLLDRVRITKAFDFVGLTEAVAELRYDLESGLPEHPLYQKGIQRRPRGTVGDSEEEEEEEEDDMLNDPVSGRSRKTDANARHQPNTITLPKSKCGLLIIDNIAQVATPLLKANHAQGQALLTAFMRSLGHLTTRHNLCTIIFNTATTYQKSTAADAVSIFSSCLTRPALGQSLTYLVDTHLLLHKLPLSAEDARAVYGTQSGAARARVNFANVLEVLQDRHGSRVGHWAAFTAEEDGTLKAIS